MSLLSRVGGLIVDAAFGLPLRATPYAVRRDVAVPMPDGVALLGDLYRPTTATGPLPVVLIRLPYGRAGLFAHIFVAPFARRGFQVFVQSTRGTFGSGGHFRPFTTEHDDGLVTLAWLREQSWCDGRVATTGGSYFGHTQWAVAPYADPPLVSASPHITAARITRAFYDHDAPGLHNALGWSVQIGRQEAGGPPAPLPRPRLEARLRRGLRRLPLQAAGLLAADLGRPGQGGVQQGRAVVVERRGDPRGGDVRRDADQRRVGVRGDRPLGVPEVAAAGHRHPPVAPRLRAQPGHGGHAVVVLGGERPEVAAGAERAARGLDEDLETAPGQRGDEDVLERRGAAVGQPDEHHGQRAGRRGGAVEVAQERHPAGCGHGDVTLDGVGPRPQRQAQRGVREQSAQSGQQPHAATLSRGRDDGARGRRLSVSAPGSPARTGASGPARRRPRRCSSRSAGA
ncbi:MAG TPA: CocE/NonD family hydrolase [Geodermatophilus sp.]|nr:CocE/NonD family hydrolase [Geodermatophilus sp.]